MTIAAPFSTSTGSPAAQRPRDDELDMHGVTHAGHVRSDNQDQFLLATVHPQVVVHGSSIPAPDGLCGPRLATILLVADGVGGSAAGSRASALATQAVTQFVTSTMRSYNTAGSSSEDAFVEELRACAMAAHDTVRAEALARPDARSMATTLSLAVVVWPWMYILQLGDSRCYFYEDGAMRQVTRDQTLAQDLVDDGVLPAETAQASPLAHVLSSAIGASTASPAVTRVDVRTRGCVVLVCTDGLTKHVSDAEIAAQLGAMRSAEQVCGDLLKLALERGGSDNITVVVGRARLPGKG